MSYRFSLAAFFVCAYQAQAFTLDKTIELALANSIAFQAQTLEAQDAKYQIYKAYAALAPQVTTQHQLNLTKRFTEAPASSSRSTSASLSITQPLYNQKAFAASRQVHLAYDIAQKNLEQQRQTLIFEAGRQYFALLTSLERVKSLESEKIELDRRAFKEQAKLEAGNATQAQSLLIESAKARIESQLSQALSTLSIQKNVLENLIGQPITHLYPTKHANYRQLKQPKTSTASSIQIQIGKLSIQSAIAERNTVLADTVPTLSLIASTQNNTTLSSTPDQLDSRQNTLSLAMQLNLSPMTAIDALSARKKIAIAKKRFSEVQQALEQNIAQLQIEHRNALAQIDAETLAIKSQQEALRASQATLEAGSMTLSDVLSTLSDLQQSRTQRAQAQHNALSTLLRLEMTLGTLDKAKVASLSEYFESLPLSFPANI